MTSPSLPRFPRLLAILPAVALLATCLGCDNDVTFTDDTLDPPTVLRAVSDVVSCPAAGAGVTLALSEFDALITLGAPSLPPVNRVDLTGTSVGLAGQAVFIAMTPVATNCPLYGISEATVLPDGSFEAAVDLDQSADERTVRLTAFAAAATTGDFGCDSAGNCVTVATGSPAGGSNSLEIRIR
jgi:hypothetical protein